MMSLFSLIIALLVVNQSISRSDAAPPANFTARLDRFTQCVMKAQAPQFDIPQLTVSVVANNETWFTRGYGTLINQSTNQTRPVDEYTLFGIGSVSKAFTSALLLKSLPPKSLYNNLYLPISGSGLSLNTYSDFLNEYGSFVDLLSHRTGVQRADLLWISQTPMNQTETVSWQHSVSGVFPHLPPTVTPRDQWLYNNYGYGQIGLYIEALTGAKYEDVLSSKFLQPLNMTSTVFGHRAARLKTGNIANLYTAGSNAQQSPIMLPIELDDVIDAIAPAGAIQTNAVDMAEWMKAQLGNRPDVFSAADLQVMHEVTMIGLGADLINAYITAANPSISQIDSGYALGWMKFALNGRLMVLHDGSTLGQISLITLFPNENIGVFTSSPAVSMHPHNSVLLWVFYELNFGSANNIIDKLCNSELGSLSDKERRTIDHALDQLSKLAGKSQGVPKPKTVPVTAETFDGASNAVRRPVRQSQIQDWPADIFVGSYSNNPWGNIDISLFNSTQYPGAQLLLTFGSLQMAMVPHSPPQVNPIFDCQTLDNNPLRFLFPGAASLAGFEIDSVSGKPSILAVALDYPTPFFTPETTTSSTGMASSSSTGSHEPGDIDSVSKDTFMIVTGSLSGAVALLLIVSTVLFYKMRNTRSQGSDTWQLDSRSHLL